MDRRQKLHLKARTYCEILVNIAMTELKPYIVQPWIHWKHQNSPVSCGCIWQNNHSDVFIPCSLIWQSRNRLHLLPLWVRGLWRPEVTSTPQTLPPAETTSPTTWWQWSCPWSSPWSCRSCWPTSCSADERECTHLFYICWIIIWAEKQNISLLDACGDHCRHDKLPVLKVNSTLERIQAPDWSW